MQEEKLDWYTIMVRKLLTILKSQKEERLPEIPAQETIGTIVCQCEGCGKTYEIFRSCGNRHCPACQGEKAYRWLDGRLDTLLPVHHFMITFTVPSAFREFFRS